jgi:hypothetical protein
MQRQIPWLCVALACVLALALPASAARVGAAGFAPGTETGTVTHVQSMPLVGGVAGLARVLRVEAPDRSRLIVDVIRRLYNQSLDTATPEDRRDVEGYFAALAALRGALPQATAGAGAAAGASAGAGGAAGAAGANASASVNVSASVSMKTIAASGGDRLLRALGLRMGEGDKAGQCLLDDDREAVARRGYLAAAGIDAEAIAKALNAGESVSAGSGSGTTSIVIARDEVPLPLGIAAWKRAVLGDGVADEEIAPAILLQKRAACFYHALASMDEPTLAYFETHPDFLAGLFQRRAEVLTTFGRSIHIQNGRVMVPGGSAAEPLWEALVERRMNNPEGFIDELLARDGGRMAYFYDTIAHVPESVRQLVLTEGEESLRALARVFAGVSVQWHIDATPMWRPAVDPAMWLNELRVSPANAANANQLAAGFTRRAWEEIFRSDNVETESVAETAAKVFERLADDAKDAAKQAKEKGVPPPGPAPAVQVSWLATRVFLDDQAQQRERFEMTLWAQRMYARPANHAGRLASQGAAGTGLHSPGAAEGVSTPEGTAASEQDLAVILAACRGYARFGVLLLTLERMDVRDPAILGAAVSRAAAIASRGGDREANSLALFEASLAIVERLRLVRRIDTDTASALVKTLVEVPLDDQEPLAFARWIDERLVPAIAPAGGAATNAAASAAATGAASAEIEPLLLDALGGLRMRASGAGSASTNGHSTAAAGASSVQWEGQSYRVDVAAAERARILAVRRAQGGISLDAALDALRPRDVGKVGKDGKPAKPNKAARKATREATAALAETLVAIVYATHLPSDRPELLQNTPWRRHDFGLTTRAENLRRKLAWQPAEELTGGGIAWHLRGSLLALDLALAPYHMRRITDDPPIPTLNEGDRTTATIGVMLLNPFDATDADRDTLVSTLTRGRAAIAEHASQPDTLLALAQRAGFSEWRQQALRWTLSRAADAPTSAARVVATTTEASASAADSALEAFASIDQFWAGEPDVATIDRLDRWGPSIIPITGQLATRLPRARAWEDFTGRSGSGVFITQMADVHLQIASFLASHHLPAALHRGAMAGAMQELVDRVQVRHYDDWSALVMYVRTLPPARFEDYVAALTVDGPLRTQAEDGEEDRE